MADLFRDTSFGQLTRLVTGRRLFQYKDESDSSKWKDYLNHDKTETLKKYGSLDEDRIQRQKTLEEEVESEGTRSSPIDASVQPAQTLDETEKKDVERRSRSSSEARRSLQEAPTKSTKGEDKPDYDVIDWAGEDDPENPRNWSTGKKVFVTFLICLLTFSVYIGSAIYTAGIQDVMKTFGVGQVPATLGLTLFVAGYGLGPMVWSPMSEMPQIGRGPIYVGTLIIFVVLQIPVALATNFGMLLAFRFLTGFFGSPVLATGGATLADIYAPRKQAYAISIWGIAAICGPTMGPLIGGFAAEAEGWTWPIWELMWLSGFCLVILFFLLPETSANNILYRRTQRIKKLARRTNFKSEPELAGELMTGMDIVKMILVRPITLNFREAIVFALNLYIGLIYALLYCWFESFPIVFVEIYGFSLGTEGLAFLGILIGAMIIIPPYFLYLYKYQEPDFEKHGFVRPEKRLQPAFVGGWAIVICLFWFGWSAGRTHWIVPIIGSAWFSIGAFLLFQAVLSYLGDAYPAYVASVFAGNDLIRSSFGAGFPLFATAMYTKLGIDWASSLLGFLALAFVPIPFFLYFYGETLRKKYSKYARKDI